MCLMSQIKQTTSGQPAAIFHHSLNLTGRLGGPARLTCTLSLPPHFLSVLSRTTNRLIKAAIVTWSLAGRRRRGCRRRRRRRRLITWPSAGPFICLAASTDKEQRKRQMADFFQANTNQFGMAKWQASSRRGQSRKRPSNRIKSNRTRS